MRHPGLGLKSPCRSSFPTCIVAPLKSPLPLPHANWQNTRRRLPCLSSEARRSPSLPFALSWSLRQRWRMLLSFRSSCAFSAARPGSGNSGRSSVDPWRRTASGGWRRQAFTQQTSWLFCRNWTTLSDQDEMRPRCHSHLCISTSRTPSLGSSTVMCGRTWRLPPPRTFRHMARSRWGLLQSQAQSIRAARAAASAKAATGQGRLPLMSQRAVVDSSHRTLAMTAMRRTWHLRRISQRTDNHRRTPPTPCRC
mmetsp:Transcript_23345/g.68149  ORF Transcript_23345/g.68149 Transcript_23345/m.68149 type:complete len:252 (-) Transcript_23345:946-1701(-)